MATCYTPMYPVFQPVVRTITAITNAPQASVTTSIPHQYLTGLIVRLIVPEIFSMYQVSGMFGEIVVTSDTTFTIAINTTTFDPFIVPDPLPQGYTCPQAIPIAEDNAMLTQAVQNVLPYTGV